MNGPTWCLWKVRNDYRFNSLNWSVERVLQEAKAIDGAYTLAFQEESTSQATTGLFGRAPSDSDSSWELILSEK